jgi:hypothetical protein
MMPIPPSVKMIAPSLQKNGEAVTLSLKDLKALLPSLEIIVRNSSPLSNGTVKMSMVDVRKILRVVLAGVRVDEEWYLGQVPELREDLQKGKFASVTEHYFAHGYLEGRLPERPQFDETHYLQSFPDVAAAIKAGRIKSGFDHFVRDGYCEGRPPTPAAKNTSQRAGNDK